MKDVVSRLNKLEKARLQLKSAEGAFIAAVHQAYPVGTIIRYTTSGYDVLYEVLEQILDNTRLKVKRAFHKSGNVRWLDGASTCVDFYREGVK
jgi:hypothetical protein